MPVYDEQEAVEWAQRSENVAVRIRIAPLVCETCGEPINPQWQEEDAPQVGYVSVHTDEGTIHYLHQTPDCLKPYIERRKAWLNRQDA